MCAKNLCIHQLYYKISYFSFGKKRRTISRPPVFGSLFLVGTHQLFSVLSFWWRLTAFFGSLFLVGTHQLLRINFFLYFIISNSRNFNNPFLQIFLFNYTVVFTPLIGARVRHDGSFHVQFVVLTYACLFHAPADIRTLLSPPSVGTDHDPEHLARREPSMRGIDVHNKVMR